MYKLSLNKNWAFQSVENGARDSKVFTGDVPITVANSLFLAGEIPDPYYGENEWVTYAELKKDYEFYNVFDISEDVFAQKVITLHCEGIDTFADIYINENHISLVEDMHRSYDFDIKPYICCGENSIRIYFKSAIEHTEALHAEEPYYTTSDTVNGFSLVRKSHCSFGWDWGQKLPDIGIFRNIEILAYSVAKIDDIYIRQTKNNSDFDIRIELENSILSPSADLNIVAIIKDPQGEIIGTVNQPLTSAQALEFNVCDPQLWWCNGFGAQPLYEISVAIKKGDDTIDSTTKRIGIRELTVRREKDEWGESFEFSINGISIFAMGANYIPEDSIYPRCSKERTQTLIEQCVKANFNCIRVWGGGYFCDDYFYDICDEYGLIVWQDLLFACGVYRLHDNFVENVIAETKDNIKRLRHHACIGLWCGNNELEWGWSGWDMGFGDKLTDKADYLKLFEWILPQTVKTVDPDRFYWLASPSSGGSFDDPNDQNRGDVHYWDVWHRLKDFTKYRDYYFRFCSEFGFQSFPCIKTIDTFAKEEDKNIFSRVMENHQKNRGANGLILYYMSANFKYPAKFDTLIYVSQVLQAEAIRYGVEHWRSNRGRCMGSLYWQLNDCWPVASWSSIDYYNRWKPLHYYTKKFYAPVLLCALEDKGFVKFVISNETTQDKTCYIDYKIRKNTGDVILEHRGEYIVSQLSSKNCIEVDFAEYAQKDNCYNHYLEYTLYDQDGNEISSGTQLFCKPKHFEFLDPQISYNVHECENGFTLNFTTPNYAKYVTIDSSDFDFVASDNCFDLSKDFGRQIFISKSDISKEVTVSDFQSLSIITAFDIK